MSWFEWLILGGIAVICIAAVRTVGTLKKKGIRCPGRMCGGCPHYCQLESNPEADAEQEGLDQTLK